MLLQPEQDLLKRSDIRWLVCLVAGDVNTETASVELRLNPSSTFIS